LSRPSRLPASAPFLRPWRRESTEDQPNRIQTPAASDARFPQGLVMNLDNRASSLETSSDHTDYKSDNNKLRAAFEAACDRTGVPQNRFYSKMRDCVFNTCSGAMARDNHDHLDIISAAPGTGKTQFTNAYIAALIETTPDASALAVVEQIKSAKSRYEALNRLVPGKVGCWTSRFETVSKNDLVKWPVVVATHATFMGDDSDKVRRFHGQERSITIVDEFLDVVDLYTATPTMVAAAWENAKASGDADAATAFGVLYKFVTNRVVGNNKLDHLSDWETSETLPNLNWFATDEAAQYLQAHRVDEQVFGWALALWNNYAFIAGGGVSTTLIGWDNRLHVTGPTVQLDATAAIDGVKQLKLPGRTYHDAPRVTYRNLRACIVTPPSRKLVSAIVKSQPDSIEYRNWVVDVVSNDDYFKPGTTALVVCKHALTGLRNSEDKEGLCLLPNWRREPDPKTGINEDDEKWQTLQRDPNGFHWDLGNDRWAALTYWGADNTGRNDWSKCSAVFLFDANHQRKAQQWGRASGWQDRELMDPRSMLNRWVEGGQRPRELDRFVLEQLMRHHKQLAMRGAARKFAYDPVTGEGACLPMTLVCGIADYGWLLEEWGRMFPGAPDPELPAGSAPTLAQRSLAYLREAQAAGRTTVHAKEVAEALGVKWPALRQALLPFLEDLPEMGWRFIPGERGKGKARPRFEKLEVV
jgi:hypothetical protein